MAWYDRLLFWRRKRPGRRKRKLRGRKLLLHREARAMGLLSMVLEGLPQESRERVLIWLGSIYPIRVVELPEAPKLVEPPEAPKLVEPTKVVAPPKPVTKPSPSASVGPELVVQAVVELEKPPEPKATYHQRRRKTERRKL